MIPWRTIHQQLKDAGKEKSRALATQCFESTLPSPEIRSLVESSNYGEAAVIRKKTKSEIAHIAIHLIEVNRANNDISAAGHAARCLEALSRIDNKAAESIVRTLING